MSVSYEPPKKKARHCTDSDTILPFYDANSEHDRIIVVGKKKFYVKSEYLASKSEYFRIIFQSDFIEKNQNIIELKEVTVKSFEQFLTLLEKPEGFKATKGKFLDLIATMAYFNATETLKIILKNTNNFDKIPKKELLEFARTFVISEITEMVEDSYLSCLEKSNITNKYQQLQYSVKYGMKRLETKLFDSFTKFKGELFCDDFNKSPLNIIMERVLSDNTDLGKKVFEKIKTRIFEFFQIESGCTLVLYSFTMNMNEAQFEHVKEDVENLIITTLQNETHKDKNSYFFDWLKFEHVLKLDKLKAFLIEHHIADFPESHNGRIIDAALYYSLGPLEFFLKEYLRKNYKNLKNEVQKKMIGSGVENYQFILNCLH